MTATAILLRDNAWTKIASAGSTVRVTRGPAFESEMLLSMGNGGPSGPVHGFLDPFRSVSLALTSDLWAQSSGVAVYVDDGVGAIPGTVSDISLAGFVADTLMGVGATPPFDCRPSHRPIASVAVTLSAGAVLTFTCEGTADNTSLNTFNPATANWSFLSGMSGQTASRTATFTPGAVNAVRTRITSWTGGTLTQVVTL